MIEIENKVTRDFLIENSPWCVRGTCMAVRGWEEGMLPKKMDFCNLSFWVEIYNLPLESINQRNSLDLARIMGKLIDADGDVCLGPFLRVKVELNTRNPLPTCTSYKVKCDEIGALPIKIENLGSFCFQYGKIGHESLNRYMRSNFNPKIVTNLKNKKVLECSARIHPEK